MEVGLRRGWSWNSDGITHGSYTSPPTAANEIVSRLVMRRHGAQDLF